MSINSVSSILEDQLQEIAHYGPVTALKYLDDSHILVGYGPFLRLLYVEKTTGKSNQIWQERVFKRNKVHCISVSLDKSAVAVAGGRSFAILDLRTRKFQEKAINEWIIAVDYTVPTELLILNSHNEVLQVMTPHRDLVLGVSNKIHCNEKSILYSGSIQRCVNGCVYIAAGTVMSGVLIWDLHSRKIVHNFTDHEGSIFAVKIDDDARYVISCSDDRSIKISSFADGKLMASAWGHGSRIWSLLFYEITESSVKIFSTGEDCSARMWNYDIKSKIFKQVKCYDNCHEGKHVWSVDAESRYWKSLVTGGADGKVRMLDFSEDLSDLRIFDGDDIQKQCDVVFEKKEVIKQFVELPKIQAFVVMTSHGRLFFHNQALGWSTIEIPDQQTIALKDFCVLRSFVFANYLVICSRSGDLLLLGFLGQSSQPVHLEFFPNTTTTPIKVINVLSWSSSDHMLLLLVSPADKFPLLAKEFTLDNDSFSLSVTYELSNPDPKAFTPTSVFFDPAHLRLFVGSRHANFAAYNLSQVSPIVPYLIRKLCPGDTVTSISNVHSTADKLIALVTVRDGIYMMIKFSKLNDSFQHEIIHQNKFTKGFVEGAFYEQDQLFLYGFRSGSFFIWNETQQLEIDHEPCGGAHRQWEFLRQDVGTSFRFNFLRNSSLISRRIHNKFGKSGDGLLFSGTHGREIRSLALCPHEDSDGHRLFALASEDATIKVGYVSTQLAVQYKWTMNNHVSGLQAVHFLDKDFFASSAANEELIMWKINREIPNNIAVCEQARIQTSGENPDLRIMDIASVECPGGFFIAAGFSNSIIKVFYYDKNKSVFSVVAEDVYSTFCILNVEFIMFENSMFLVAGTTDGVVTIWDISYCLTLSGSQDCFEVFKFGTPKIKQQLHQSGVKALLLIPTSSKSWKIVTGGDDNALLSANLSINAAEISLTIDSFVENAASATITGIVRTAENLVFVTSVDQIMRKWNYDKGLVCSAATYTTVADTGCCISGNIGEKNFAIVGGAGLSIFEI
ncbi:WD40 repeat-like protein [Metschnikowia bicuspidata var. bicuspidata NRRL YB-4993]|uniref:WD40 repeat-like protein n=1 Tax=Metschnikowia bicuspidata var. bicuspidata NRRL YB-4993 TaxID=869754 RepID=A0A1A0H6P4_9ASCO|nr:WD40 repeat-like protein [Metschnikowia bicuspidata var. bicuspidata NRRL YB-4993]OBA19630.1 WD40 repeat-like protein [Metschnikowia bicuspidata var. bicuspidata NRRL YB-4993]